jgi:hypothetical protein
MPGYFAPTLPGFRAPSGIDTSGLNEGIDAIGRKFEQNRLLKQSQEIGQAVQSGDFNAGAKAAFGYGDLNTGLQLSNTQRQIETEKYNRQRQAVADQRAAAEAARSSEAHKYKIEGLQDERHTRLVSRMAGAAQRIMQETDPEKKAIMTHQLFGAHPRLQKQFQQYGLDPNNPDQVLNMIISEARGYQEPSKKDFITVAPGSTVYDPREGSPVYTAPGRDPSAKAPSGYRYGEAGDLEFIPGGPADPASKVNDAKFSEGAAKAANFTNMMVGAENALGPVTENPLGFFDTIKETLPEGVANVGRSPKYQAYRQAAMQWVRAKLRKESGAAISSSEFEGEFQTFFPQYGDSPEVIQQKNAAREQATLGMKAESRGAYDHMFNSGGQSALPQQTAPQPQQSAPQASPYPQYPNAKQAQDGHWYVEQGGQFYRIDQ